MLQEKPSLEHVLTLIKALSPDDQVKLREKLDELLAEARRQEPPVPEEMRQKLEGLERVAGLVADLTEAELKEFDEATSRRPWFGGRDVAL